MTAPAYAARQRELAADWKRTTATLPEAAREQGPYFRNGTVRGPTRYEHCLPHDYADWNLLPEVRRTALEVFEEVDARWHDQIDAGPTNNLLSSQVQCVNALGQMVHDPERLVRAFAEPLGTRRAFLVEPGHHLTFEYIGPTDYFGESPGRPRVRGARCTSLDAAFLHETVDGCRELILIEWKYTEAYEPRIPDPRKDAVRQLRYEMALMDPDGPVRGDVLDFADLLDEPIYQHMRQQLLAHHLERNRVLGVDRVRLVHVSPADNLEYQRSVSPAQREIGETVDEVWRQLLRHEDRFVSLDSSLFLDPGITSEEYVVRYSPA